MTVLQIRFQGVRHLTGARLAVTHPLSQLGEEPLATLPPILRARLDDRASERRVAGHESRRQHGRRRVEVFADQRRLLIDRSNGVAEFAARVPDRIPDRRGKLLHPLRTGRVHQQEINIAERGEFPAPEPTGGDERDPRRPRGRLPRGFVKRDDPLIGGGGERMAERPTLRRTRVDHLRAASERGRHRPRGPRTHA